MELPEQCCARCRWWIPNRVDNFKAGDEKTCWKHNKHTEDDFCCEYFFGIDNIGINVPQHTANGIMIEQNRPMPEVACEGLIVTYGTPTMRVSGKVVSELDWLDYSLRSWFKWCKGFQGLTIAHPNHEMHLFVPFAKKYDIRLHGYDEVKGKGFVQHQAMLALADTFLPSATTHVLSFDADCIWKMETTPMDYFHNDKPIYKVRPYESLISVDPKNPNSPIISDCYQWKIPTERQLGFKTEIYSMLCHPTILPIGFYPKYRAQVESVHKKSLLQFHLDGQNAFPQNVMDWTAMGAFAYAKMHNEFTWFNCETEEYPQDRLISFWSHGSTTPEIKAQMEKLIAGEPAGDIIRLG